MARPVDQITLQAAREQGWTVGNAGEANLALQLQFLGYSPADVHTQFALGPYKLDFALVAERIDIEADGWVHTARTVQRRDQVRDRQLREWGWTVVRVDVDGDIATQLNRKVPSNAHLPQFDATMRQLWALFGVAVDRLSRRGVQDPAVRIARIRDAIRPILLLPLEDAEVLSDEPEED